MQTSSAHFSPAFGLIAGGRLLRAHRLLQQLSDKRGIDYLHSSSHFPEIGPDLANLDAMKDSIDKVKSFHVAMTCCAEISLTCPDQAACPCKLPSYHTLYYNILY